jgi:hypothetical protein
MSIVKGPGNDNSKITTAEGCKAKAKQIRKAPAHLSDPEAVVRAFEMASRWDEKAAQIAVKEI